MFVTDRKICRRSLIETVEQAVEGGVNIVHLREKDLPSEELLRLAEDLRKITEDRALLVINGNVNVARACGADGMHLPQNGPAIFAVREALGENALIGRSVHSPNEAINAHAEGADYIVLGTIYDTPSKPGLSGAGTSLIRETQTAVDLPILAIGGITPMRVPEVLRAGASGVAVRSAILRAEDPRAVCQEFRLALDRALPAKPAPEIGKERFLSSSFPRRRESISGETKIGVLHDGPPLARG